MSCVCELCLCVTTVRFLCRWFLCLLCVSQQCRVCVVGFGFCANAPRGAPAVGHLARPLLHNTFQALKGTLLTWPGARTRSYTSKRTSSIWCAAARRRSISSAAGNDTRAPVSAATGRCETHHFTTRKTHPSIQAAAHSLQKAFGGVRRGVSLRARVRVCAC